MLTLTHGKVKYKKKSVMLSASEDYSRQQVKISVHEMIKFLYCTSTKTVHPFHLFTFLLINIKN